jgi:Transmembrane secretion effector
LRPLRLLRQNPGFARLWAAEVVSLGGDWFTIIALAVLVSGETRGSGLALGGLVLTQLLPAVLFAPLAGVIVDRVDRRRLLIASDLTRALVVASFIPAATTGRPGPLYALAFLHFTIATVFEPGRAALLPRLLATSDLVAGSTLSSVTWSVMVAVGGLAGGSLLAAAGTTAVFTWDALTFLGSAALIASIPADAAAFTSAERGGEAASIRFTQALRYLRREPATGAALLGKAMNGIAVADSFMVIYGTRVFVSGAGGSFSLGALYASFGLGALVAPMALNLLNDGSSSRMRSLIAAGAALLAAGLLLLSRAPSLGVACLGIGLRGMGGSTVWTFSTIILQKNVPQRMLGRVFALDFALAQLVAVVFALGWGVVIDTVGVRPAVLAAGGLALLPALFWSLGLRRMNRWKAAVH